MADPKPPKKRYLTKTRYKLATECPTKLYYTGKKEYANQKNEDSFLAALAEGGFQVGALAKLYVPDGVEVASRDYETSLNETNELLKREEVTIYEAAVQYGDYFIRADILVKKGDHLDLIEVKAKSINLEDEEKSILTDKGYIRSGWQSYLKDVAFQKYVIRKAFPEYSVTAWLMLADKTADCPTDGLNQKFRTKEGKDGRAIVIVSPSISPADLKVEILTKQPVDDHCELIYAGNEEKEKKTLSYDEQLEQFAETYKKDDMFPPPLSSTCSKCEFRATLEDKAKGLKSGFENCWMKTLKWTEKDLEEPTILDIWMTRKKDQFISESKYKMKQINESDIAPKKDEKLGLSQSERIWMQIEKVKNNDNEIYIDRTNLKQAMKFTFPLHFIDFETSRVAVPFNKGRHPYEGIVFQFSHHTVEKDGTVEHKGEYINAEPGVFPNYDFVRALKKELENDNGSIFMFATHENTCLMEIRNQLLEDKSKISDKKALVDFINSVTSEKLDKKKDIKRIGKRALIDMRELVLRFYYDPYTEGSNSIKDILPAVLRRSDFLRDKYSKPIYGAKNGIPSRNYKDKQWLIIENGVAKDPYSQLPKLFQDVNKYDVELLSDFDELKAGGNAAIAYAKLQFEEMSDYERKELKSALLKYCELDTLAMVMIYECWRELLKG